MVLKFSISESLGGPVKIPIAAPPRVSDSVDMGFTMIICITNKFPGSGKVAYLMTTF